MGKHPRGYERGDKIIWECAIGTGQRRRRSMSPASRGGCAQSLQRFSPRRRPQKQRSPYEREVKAALALWSEICISARRGARKQGRAAARMK